MNQKAANSDLQSALSRISLLEETALDVRSTTYVSCTNTEIGRLADRVEIYYKKPPKLCIIMGTSGDSSNNVIAGFLPLWSIYANVASTSWTQAISPSIQGRNELQANQNWTTGMFIANNYGNSITETQATVYIIICSHEVYHYVNIY